MSTTKSANKYHAIGFSRIHVDTPDFYDKKTMDIKNHRFSSLFTFSLNESIQRSIIPSIQTALFKRRS